MQEQLEHLKKIRGSCQIIRGFLHIALGFLVLFGVLYLVYGIKVAAAPETAFTVTENRFGGLSIDMEGQTWSAASSIPYYASPMGIYADYSAKTLQFANLGLSVLLVLLPFAAVILLVLRILTCVMKGSSPFCPENIRSLKIIGWIMLFLGLAVKILYLLGITYLVFGGKVRGMSYLIDYGAAFTGGLLLVLARIFEYGTYLQNEYDSTL